MPMPELDIIVAPASSVHIQLEPVQSNLHSLLLLVKAEQLSGLGSWVTETAAALTPEEFERHYLVVIGLHYAIMPDQSWGSFPDYLAHLAQVEPTLLRDRILDTYHACPLKATGTPAPAQARARLLADVDYFLAYLTERFSASHVNEAIERRAHVYLNDPPALQRLIVDHLQMMWDRFLAAEWRRVEPMLRDSIAAFRELDLSGMSRPEIAELVAGQPIEGRMRAELEEAEHLVLAPHAHVGPYLGHFTRGRTMGLLFRARLPEGTDYHAPDLSRSELLVRLAALADDTRLRILKLVAEWGELSSQAIMTELGLSQSATSRHLKQLTATGYLAVRRCDGAKCYSLVPARLDNTFRALLGFID